MTNSFGVKSHQKKKKKLKTHPNFTARFFISLWILIFEEQMTKG